MTRARCIGFSGLCLLAMLALAAGSLFFRGRSEASEKTVPERPRHPVEVQLANRTLCVTGFPVRFSEHQTASVRGTAPYVVVLADSVSKAEALAAARDCGARVIGPLPPKALLVETSVFALGKLSADPHFAAAAEWLPEDKIDNRLKALLAAGGETLDMSVVALSPADVEPLVALAAERGGERMKGCLDGRNSATLHLPRALVEALAKRGDVRWLEPFKRPKPLNDMAVGPTAMNVRTIWETHGLDGSGQLLTTSDTGIDTGDLATMHADLRSRLIGFEVVDHCYPYDQNGHGTHTAGSIVGDGTMSDGQFRGTAFGARLWAWFCDGEDGYIYTPVDCGSLFRPSGRADEAFIHSASWGDYHGDGSYSTQTANIDAYVWNHPDFLPVFANGNSGPKATSVGAPATAKNVLSVGAGGSVRTGNEADIFAFSSRGPCKDGRIKPDVCSPGADIVSALSCQASRMPYPSNANYTKMSGTSMATPLTAGAAALVRQWLVERRGFTNAVPTAALIKAVLTGGAKGVAVPDNAFGWGHVDLGESLYPCNRAVRLADRVPFFAGVDSVACEVTLTNTAPFDVQLVWIDYPATAGATRTLVNDLDLIVSNRTTGAVWYGNGTAEGDRTNTVESVRIAAAVPGDYTVLVRGYEVWHDSTEGGAAAVYVRGAFEEERSLEITAANPAEASVTMSIGETNVFSVTVETTPGVTPDYSWTVDGAAVGASTNEFVYGTDWPDHGCHSIRVVATADGSLSSDRTWTVVVRGEVRVDAATGDDETATGSSERPYASIVAALEKSVAGDVLHVGPGAYAGGLVTPAAAVRIEATDGPEATVIDGGGTNRCFDASLSPETVLAGFTLTNGWADASVSYDYGAGAFCGVLTNCVIRDCRVEGDGGVGGGAAFATLVDCIVENCCGDYAGGGLYNCSASFCLIRGNETWFSNSYGGGAAVCGLAHCTVYGNASGQSAGGVDADSVCTNSIVWGNILFNGETSNWESYTYNWRTYRTSFASSCTEPTGYADRGGNTNAAPRWVDAAAGDFRLAIRSPCLGTADDGRNMGRWQGAAVSGYILTATAIGPGTVEPEEKFVEEGLSATFTATTHHPFFGWRTNDTEVADSVSPVFTWTDVRADGVLTAVFGTTNFFVDAEAGCDASNGWSRAEAKRTLQAAVDVAWDGETVSVAPGVYTGVVCTTAAEIDIVGTDGPNTTFLTGDAENRCFEASFNPATRLRGFTLTGGTSADNYGGGVFFGTLSNCVIRNCFAKRGGGGGYGATLLDCVIADCRTDGQGGGASGSVLVNCTVRGNSALALRSKGSEFAGGGVDCQCVCTNTVLWENTGPAGGTDNWEVYKYWASTYVPIFAWCCTTPFNAVSENSINADPMFVADDDLADVRVYEISPCLGAGEGGVNIGAYRGTGVVKALPEIDVGTATGEDVSNAVASVGFVDPAVPPGIGTNGATYAAFRTWSTNGLRSTAVVFSPRAYDSFLLRELVAAPMLLGEGRETRVTLEALEPSSDGTCSTTLRILDGGDEIPLCSDRAAFAKHAEVGDEPAELHPADAANVETAPIDDGRAMKLIITPPLPTSRYFLRFVIR